MSFTARQVHCLQAMGLVAWTCHVESAPAAEGGLSSTLGAAVSASVFTMPSDVLQLAEWILEQPLAPFRYRGADVSFTGSEQAMLMVVCIQPESSSVAEPVQLPLSSEGSQMLSLMLRAIDIQATAIRQCAMFTHAPAQVPGEPPVMYLDAIRTSHVRAVLVLDPQIDKVVSEPESDSCLMPVSSLPLWRVPHPEQLLRSPALKRRAWESLKGLKKALGSSEM